MLLERNIDIIHDYTTDGFIDANTFQVLVSASPDEACRGLVERRTNSFKKAGEKAYEDIERVIFEYMETDASTDGKDYIREASAKYARLSKKTAEYFREDQSAVIVFRIRKNDLKNLFEQIKYSNSRAENK